MSLPSESDGLENQADALAAARRDPSYPDRARIDSDVRAFLRPSSNRWILFDRDSRPDFALSALRLGAVFASSPSLPANAEAAAESPPSEGRSESAGGSGDVAASSEESASSIEGDVVTSAPPLLELAQRSMVVGDSACPRDPLHVADLRLAPEPEPSSLVVAADPAPEANAMPPADPSLPPEEIDRSRAPIPRRRARIAGLGFGVLALVTASTVAVLALRSRGGAPSAVPAAVATEATAAASDPLTEEPIEIDSLPAVDPAARGESSTSIAAPSATTRKSRFGRLAIRGDARHKSVWIDGKRVMGTGPRSIVVFCGPHTVAVTEKSDAKAVEIPCGGEYAVTR